MQRPLVLVPVVFMTAFALIAVAHLTACVAEPTDRGGILGDRPRSDLPDEDASADAASEDAPADVETDTGRVTVDAKADS